MEHVTKLSVRMLFNFSFISMNKITRHDHHLHVSF